MVHGDGGRAGWVVELLTQDLLAEITKSCNKFKKNHCEVAV